MNKAQFALIKYNMRFTGDDGREITFDYVDFEVAPNLFSRFKLTPNNERALMRYNPDLYQLIKNIPYGSEVIFQEISAPQEVPKPSKSLSGIYTNAENEL